MATERTVLSPLKRGRLKPEEIQKAIREVGIPKPAITREAIAKRAYEKYLARGSRPGFEEEDWFAAEQELLAEYLARKKHA